jgi:ABC-2 type transport system permease protein
MKKIMRLVSVQLWAVLGDTLSIGKSGKKSPRLLYAGLLFFTLLMSAISLFYSMMIGTGLKMFDSLDILPAMMMSVTCLIVLMTTVFKVKGTIFGFRDYDMVMSLPVSTGVIVASRVVILYALNLLFVIIMIVPMMISYGILARPGVMFYIIGIITMFFIPLLPLIAASILGTIIAYAASKFRYSNLLNIIFSLGLLAAVIAASFTMGDSGQELVDMSRALTDEVNSFYPLARLYTDAVVHTDIAAFVYFVSISIAASVIYIVIVKQLFKKLNTLMMTGRSRVNFKMGQLKTSPPWKALYFKELKRYFSSPVYVLNTGFGIVMLTLGAIALLFVDLDQVLKEPQATDMVAGYGPIFIIFCVVMTCSTMASISLEGKNFWIIKSMPVTSRTVYLSKAAVNLTIISPAIIDTILIGIALKSGLMNTLSMLLVTITSAIFISLFGLLINLLLPNFNWTSDVVVIKQSAASMVTIFSGIAYAAVQFLLIMLLPSITLAYLAYALLTLIVDIGLYMILMTYGKTRYTELS